VTLTLGVRVSDVLALALGPPEPVLLFPTGVRVCVAVAFGIPATPPQVGSNDAVSNEIAVEVKLNWTPGCRKLDGIAGTAPVKRQLSTQTEPLENLLPFKAVLTKKQSLTTSCASVSVEWVMAPMGLLTKQHCRKVAAFPRHFWKQPWPSLQLANRRKVASVDAPKSFWVNAAATGPAEPQLPHRPVKFDLDATV
jgi:hypothetical protein